jgi:hypothetical protein
VRVLGLGGVVTFDYSEDPRKARLVGCDEDYVNFEGEAEKQQILQACISANSLQA